MAFLYAVETIWDHNPSPEELLEFDITDEEAIEFRTKISHPDYLGIAEIYHMRGDRKRMEEYIALGLTITRQTKNALCVKLCLIFGTIQMMS